MANHDPRVTIHMAASLDGFIARKDGRTDWLETSDEFAGGDTVDSGCSARCESSTEKMERRRVRQSVRHFLSEPKSDVDYLPLRRQLVPLAGAALSPDERCSADKHFSNAASPQWW